MTFRETAKVIAYQNKPAMEFVSAALTFGRQARIGHMTAEKAAENVINYWNKLAKDAKDYLLGKFPALKEISSFTS
ncbi:hypothetical protein COOONC_07790 [Cooperia oncophora]